MYIERNDPCPCGSGKKYEECCLAKDEEAAREIPLNPFTASEILPETVGDDEKPRVPPDPRAEAWGERWYEFSSSNYENRIDLFTQTLDEPELMDEEMAYEMLNELFIQAEERNERDRFDALTDKLREKLPNIYEKNEGFMISWRITNAIIQGRSEIIPTFINDLGRLPGIDIDLWNRVESLLAYYGHLTTLTAAMRLGWTDVRDSAEIVPWGIDEFSYCAVQYEILNYLGQTSSPDANDPVLHEKIEHFYGKDYFKDNIAEEINIFTGQLDRQWTLADFNLPMADEEQDEVWEAMEDWDDDGLDEENGEWEIDDDIGDIDYDDDDDDDWEVEEYNESHPAEDNLRDLTYQFVWYARTLEGVPYSKAEMARLELRSFILERHEGTLEYRGSMYDEMLRNEGVNPKPLRKYNPYNNLLVPDRERFEQFIVNMFQIWSPQPYRAAALMELLPVWLRFLQSQGLIDEELCQRTLFELKPIADDLLKIYRRGYHDRALCDAMERWK
jgi:SEC-C motif